MRRIRGKYTKPEQAVRRLLRAIGVPFSQHSKRLPGRPDFVIRARKKAVFVHGCFWHAHAKCATWRMPKSRVAFWQQKLDANRRRDSRNQRQLRLSGWKLLVVWECELPNETKLAERLERFLGA